MFWDKGYAPSQNIEALLEKKNVTVEEFLDDEDILQECKAQKKILINYFTRSDVIKRLVELIITEPSEELPIAQRFRHTNMACEILTLGLPSLDEKILSDANTLRSLYSYLENEPPLNPLQSSFFSKTFSMLFTKKPEQDWFLYQQTCLQFLEYVKSQKNFLELVCKHFSTPVIPDLIMQMMQDVDGASLKRNLYEWLTEDKLVERLIFILGNPQETDKHANVAEFLCDLIQQGRSMRQTDSENDSFEPAFNGSNPILQVIESKATTDALMNIIFEPNASESTIISGISVVLTLIRPVAFVDEPNSDRLKLIQSRERDTHEQVLETVIGVIAPRLKDFNDLIRNPPLKPEIITTSGKLSPPFGMVRLQICRVFTVLLQSNNEAVSEAIGETDFFETLLFLFKQYCWNNFLHSEVEKCLQLVFYSNLSTNNSMQGSTVVNDGSFNKNNSGDNNLSVLIFGDVANVEKTEQSFKSDTDVNDCMENDALCEINANGKESADIESEDALNHDNENAQFITETETISEDNHATNLTEFAAQVSTEQQKGSDENNATDITTIAVDSGPSVLQMHAITKCKIVSRLIDCWQHNKEMQSAEKGRRLGYMGHLIKIFKHITNCISEFEHIGALIEANLNGESELELWQSITNANDGELTQALAIQGKMLANCNAHEAADYSQHLPKEFLNDNITADFNDDIPRWTDMSEEEVDSDDDENTTTAGDSGSRSLFFKPSASTSALNTFGVTSNPWDTLDPFNVLTTKSNDLMPAASTPWTTDLQSDNFADFDSHFSSFSSDLGESLSAAVALSTFDDTNNVQNSAALNAFNPTRTTTTETAETGTTRTGNGEEYDNNANVENCLIGLEHFTNFVDDENAKNERVLRNSGNGDVSEDDMACTTNSDEKTLNSVQPQDDILEELKETPALISNGPSKAATQYNNEHLHISNDDITARAAKDDVLSVAIASEGNVKVVSADRNMENPLHDAAVDANNSSQIAAVNSVQLENTS